jgi:uncharacterized protein YdeI (YjbR/CyaY-like superfamily)
MDADVDAYIAGSQQWPDVISALRPILVAAGLDEQIKWAKPCYAHDGKNVAIVQEMKGFLALMFFKGALLGDPAGVLEEQGPNSRSARRMQFTSVDDVTGRADTITSYVREAIALERAGSDVGPAPVTVFVPELRQRLDQDRAFRVAFEGLTPGRQREYNLYFAGAKQAATRASRVEKYSEKILDGKGFRDR